MKTNSARPAEGEDQGSAGRDNLRVEGRRQWRFPSGKFLLAKVNEEKCLYGVFNLGELLIFIPLGGILCYKLKVWQAFPGARQPTKLGPPENQGPAGDRLWPGGN